jgi:hypothetical protein
MLLFVSLIALTALPLVASVLNSFAVPFPQFGDGAWVMNFNLFKPLGDPVDTPGYPT